MSFLRERFCDFRSSSAVTMTAIRPHRPLVNFVLYNNTFVFNRNDDSSIENDDYFIENDDFVTQTRPTGKKTSNSLCE